MDNSVWHILFVIQCKCENDWNNKSSDNWIVSFVVYFTPWRNKFVSWSGYSFIHSPMVGSTISCWNATTLRGRLWANKCALSKLMQKLLASSCRLSELSWTTGMPIIFYDHSGKKRMIHTLNVYTREGSTVWIDCTSCLALTETNAELVLR